MTNTMKALIVIRKGLAEIKDWDIPTVAEDEVLVKVEYAASNPTDWKHLDNLSPPGVELGCDLAGTVTEVGSKASRFKVGDKIAGFVHGGKYPDKGSYAEYAKIKDPFGFKVPSEMSLDQAATFGCAYITAAMAIFHEQKIPYPPHQSQGWFLVTGGATSVGMFAIQLAKLAGFEVIATASPKSFDLVKSYGADKVVSYHDIDAAIKEIKEVTGGVSNALDCVGGEDNTKLAFTSFKEDGGKLTTLIGIPEGAQKHHPNVKAKQVVMYTIGGYAFEIGPGWSLPSKPEDKQWMEGFAMESESLMQKVRANPVDLRDGLVSVLPGLQQLKDGKVSGKKLVYKIAK